MTYGIVMAILVLALIAVVTAVVFITDEETSPDPEHHLEKLPVDESPATMEHVEPVNEGDETRDFGVVELSETADRDPGPVGVRAGSGGGLAG